MAKKPNIFVFTDYRKFLAEWIAWKRTTGPYSERWFSRQAGFGAPNVLRLVINGKRNLSRKSLPLFSRVLGLGFRESKYFEDMVWMNQSATPREKSEWYERMVRNPGRRQAVPLERAQLRLFQHWLGPVIYELMNTPDFSADPEWIVKKVRDTVSVKEVRGVLRMLAESGWVSVQKNGKYERKAEFVDSGDNVNGLMFHAYHEQALAKAADALAELSSNQRHYFVITAATAPNFLPKLKALAEKFEQDLLEQLDNKGEIQPNKDVYQVSVQIFPIAGDVGKSSKRKTRERSQ